jgi:hypothetical protein
MLKINETHIEEQRKRCPGTLRAKLGKKQKQQKRIERNSCFSLLPESQVALLLPWSSKFLAFCLVFVASILLSYHLH